MKFLAEFTQTENKFFSWDETEKVSELLQRRELIWFKMVELHMREAVTEHWKNFHKDKPPSCIFGIPPSLTWEEYKAQLAQLTNSTPDKQTDQGQQHLNPKPTAEGQIEPESSRSHFQRRSTEISLPTPQIMDNTAKELTNLQDRVSSLDLKVERMRDDTNLTRHHTVQLRRQLETSVDGLEIKMDVLEGNLVRHVTDSQQTLIDEVGVAKITCF
ncbi:hypothetical protein F511_19998 [Dorcoceras hygrometricum]|uniref:Uncharacterized protein n=1 Tax=Dorcoceras hygrometricum TaxID=472368 RepID=A0A2Z7A7Z2_9LAMI|nr:hypothetical protein F511_19998 [Dorcoceras hygrometricum]